jgi:hypothetical protein
MTEKKFEESMAKYFSNLVENQPTNQPTNQTKKPINTKIQELTNPKWDRCRHVDTS